MAENSFLKFFTGEEQHHRLYAFTPKPKQDQQQADPPVPRVLLMLDQYAVTKHQSIFAVRYPGAESWDMLPDDLLAALALAVSRVRLHIRRQSGAKVTLVQSETSIPEPHVLLVPTYKRGDVMALWTRKYTDDERTPQVELDAATKTLAIPEALRLELDTIFATVNWDQPVRQPQI